MSCRNCNDTEKVYRGCINEPKQDYLFEFKGKKDKLLRCPIKLVHPVSLQYLKLYKYFKKGFLPFPGTISHQPAKLLAIFDIIEYEINLLQEKHNG